MASQYNLDYNLRGAQSIRPFSLTAAQLNILAYNPGHDGAVVQLRDGRLVVSMEAEKNSNYRYSPVSGPDMLTAMGELDSGPDVIAVGGWWPRDHHESLHGSRARAGYRGVSETEIIEGRVKFLSRDISYVSSSHERSHLMCAYGLSKLPQGERCYALVWEGEIGAFYHIDGALKITLIGNVLSQPGNRYGLVYGLADPTFPKDGTHARLSDAGKLMALASFATRRTPSNDEKELLEFILEEPFRDLSAYEKVKTVPHLDAGVENPEFRNFAGICSDAIFDVFHRFAKENLEPGLPLLISGGCGLNCDWNSQWVATGLFSEVFVPPVANDSGSALGTAIDAQFRLTGRAKVEWDVYSGLAFRDEAILLEGRYDVAEASYEQVADWLASGLILGWVNGRSEIGPRALGNRSILAAPFHNETRMRLNEIKRREQFRPIAPVCLREDAETWFGCRNDSPYMLFTYRATTEALAAVTHVNGTARLQTVTDQTNAPLYALLTAFKARTGYGVLCNTSLNFNGRGFINNLRDLDIYAVSHGLDGFVVNGRAHILKASQHYQSYLAALKNA